MRHSPWSHPDKTRADKKEIQNEKLIRSVALVASVGAMLCVAGCGCGGEEKPEDVVLKVLSAVQAGKADEEFLKKYCDDNAVTLIGSFSGMMAQMLNGASFTVMYSCAEHDVAVVKIKATGGAIPAEDIYAAKKIDNKWKLSANAEHKIDYIAQETVDECVKALNAAFLGDDDAKCNDRCTQEVLEAVSQIRKSSPVPPEDIEKIKSITAMSFAKSKNNKDAVTIQLNNGNSIDVMVVDGKWKVIGFK